MSKIFTKVIVHTVNDLTNHYWLSEIVIWQVPKPVPWKVAKPECPLLWLTLNVQLRHICLPQTWSHQDSQALCILHSHLPFGTAPPGFQPGLAAWRNSLSSLPPPFPSTVCKPWPSARGMVLVALTAEYQEYLKAGPFDVHYQCISAWWHCDCSTRMRCVDTFCWHLSLTYLYREDGWNVPVSYFFLNVLISLSLNDSAHNILNDVLKIILDMVLLEACSSIVLVSLMVSWCLSSSRV